MSNSRGRLGIVGCYPPPHGGVASEVVRLRPLLERRGVDYVVYNAVSESEDGEQVVSVSRGRWIWMLRYILTAKESAVYLMSDRLLAWLAGALMARWRGKRVLVQLRNAVLPEWIAHSRWRRMLAGFALRRVSAVVCVSHLLMETAESVGVDPAKIWWFPAFLPPSLSESDRDHVAPEVWEFAKDHRPLIAANGKVNWCKGEDLYGLDHLVELAGRLKPDYPRIGIVICFWDHQSQDQSYLDRLRERAAQLGVTDNLLFNTQNGVFVPVLQEADVFVRPTNTDGDAVSVREALFIGIPTVASDAVARPDGTILFRTRDLDEFVAAVRSALASGGEGGQPRRTKPNPEDQRRIEAYLDLLSASAEGGPLKRSPRNMTQA